jgi:DNA-binding MarR family transcriptional regulator
VSDDNIDLFRNQLRALHRRMRREQPSMDGLSTTAYEILIAIDVADELRQPGQLGEELQMTSPNVSAALRSLEGLGLIVRRKDPNDRRKAYIEISDEGRSVIGDARQGWRAWLRDAIEHHLTDAEQELLFKSGHLMQRLAEDVEFGTSASGRPGARSNGSYARSAAGSNASGKS